jgi:hypothetical protein
MAGTPVLEELIMRYESGMQFGRGFLLTLKKLEKSNNEFSKIIF